MEKEKTEMKPIWDFVGLMLASMGLVVLIAGVANYLSPPVRQTIFSNLHPELWWGILMILVGLLFYFFNRRSNVE